MPQTYTDDIIKKTGLGQFDLILMAAQRAGELQKGATSTVKAPGRSPTVAALAEIEQGAYTQEHFEKGPNHTTEEQADEHHTTQG